jgi:hypothetical protein
MNSKEEKMALTKTLTLIDNFKEEVIFKNAYIKIDSITGNKKNLDVVVGKYKSSGGEVLSKSAASFEPLLSDKNFIAQAYDHIKTLPEFAGATDC